jgi:hypothetical protein
MSSETIYLIYTDGGLLFTGTIADADNAYGLRIDADEDDLLDFVKTTLARRNNSVRLFKQIGTGTIDYDLISDPEPDSKLFEEILTD